MVNLWCGSLCHYSYISPKVISIAVTQLYLSWDDLNWLWHRYISTEIISINCDTVISLLKLSQLTVTQLYLSWNYLNCCDIVISLLKLSQLTVTQLYLSWDDLNWLWHRYISTEIISINCDTVISLLKLSQLTVTQLYLSWNYLN